MARLLNEFREWGLLFLIVLLPFPYGAAPVWARAGYMIFVIIFAASWALEHNARSKGRLPRTPVDLPLILVLAWAGVTTWTSVDRHDSSVETVLYLCHALMFWMIVATYQWRDQIRRLTYVVIATGGFLSVFGLLQYMDILPHGWWHKRFFLSSTYVNHNHFAGYLELIFPVALGMRLYARGRWEQLALSAAVVLMGVTFGLTLSRGGWLALSGAMIVYVVLMWKASPRRPDDARGPSFIRKWGAVIGLAAIVIVALSIASGPLLERFETMTDFDEDTLTYEARPLIYQATLSVIADNPVFGSGPGTFVHVFQQYRPDNITYRIHYAHNDYLQMAAELGLVGVVLFLGVGIAFYRTSIATLMDSTSRFRRYVVGGYIAGIVSITLHSVVDFNLHIPANAALVAVWAGVIMGYGQAR